MGCSNKEFVTQKPDDNTSFSHCEISAEVWLILNQQPFVNMGQMIFKKKLLIILLCLILQF